MPDTEHCRCHVTTGAVNNLNRNFSPLELDGVKSLFVASTMLAVFLKMAFERGGACWPADAVSLATVNQTHRSLPDGRSRCGQARRP